MSEDRDMAEASGAGASGAEASGAGASGADSLAAGASGGESLGERVTLIVPSISHAAIEIHRQRMWDKGYRLESKIQAQRYFESDGYTMQPLFDGKEMYAATFVKRDDG